MLNSLERKIGWLTVHNLPVYLVTAQAIVYVWNMLNPGFSSFLVFDTRAIFGQQEYWRLITFLLVTPLQNPLFQFFFLYLLYVYGTALEEIMGSFALTLFYLVGALGTILGAVFFGGAGGSFFLNTSIFLAFAALNPNFELLLFFIIPVKIKWLAWLTWAGFIYMLIIYPFWIKISILVSMANYFLFFGPQHWNDIRAYIRRKNYDRNNP